MKLFNFTFCKPTRHFIIKIFGIKFKIKKFIITNNEKYDYLYSLLNHCIDITKIPPAKGEIRKIQDELIILMNEIDSICRNNNLQYWLDSGTLLGAYRHKGFIPWDADIDICMMRSDYDKIRVLLKKHLKNPNFYIRERAISCNNFQIRIISKNKLEYGLDIFPVDEYPEEELTPELKEKIKNKMIKAQTLFNKKYNQGKNFTSEKYKQALEDLITYRDKYILENNTLKVNKPILFFGIDFSLEGKYSFTMPNNYIFPLKELSFEGQKYFCPNNVEAYLNDKYNGNYMNFPKFINNVTNGEIKYLKDLHKEIS
ncbi:TPA: hypothetical protein CPT80_00650 [Candidatus Gastranaerophilales bacterium HUM_9]|nr:MAG TPA: hypothetical protein CPT80_00650 [Candidatus Gastranaerophilales bacterium HUM_9]HBX35557.1 hypothetical protein [Cyanobacteria bacterium UBA11440]